MISNRAKVVLAALMFCSRAMADEDLAASWSTTIDVAGRQRMLTQKMSKEFGFIASGFNVSENLDNLNNTMNLFETSLYKLINGDSADNIIASPSDQVSQDLQTVVDMWVDFKQLLQGNALTVRDADGQVNAAVVDEMATKSPDMLTQTNKVVQSLVSASYATGLSLVSTHIDIAGRQRMLIQRMSKELVLIGLNANAEGNIVNLEGSADLFDSSHEGLLLGLSWAGVSRINTRCSLRQMGIVASHWQPFQNIIVEVAYATTVNESAKAATRSLGNISDIGSTLFSSQVDAVKILVKDDTSCDVIQDANTGRWAAIVNSAGKQRMLTIKAVRLFLLVVAEVDVESSQFGLTVTTSDGQENLRELIEGNPQKCPAIISPPTDDIAAQLLVSYDSWAKFELTTTRAVESNQRGKIVAKQVADLGLDFLAKMNQAAGLYADLVTQVDPLVPAHIMNFAGRQRMLLQKMAMEAVLIYLGVEVNSNWVNMNKTRNLFASSHGALLRGDDKIDATTDICIVQQMKKVDDEYKIMDEACLLAANGDKKGVETIAARSDSAFSEMNAVVTMMVTQASTSTGGETCGDSASSSSGACAVATHSTEQYKLWLVEYGKLRFLTQKVAFNVLAKRVPNPKTALPEFPTATYTDVVQTLDSLLFGNGPIAAPQTQGMIDYLIHVSATQLTSFESTYNNISKNADRETINAPSLALMEAANNGMNQYIGGHSDQTVTRRMNFGSRQIMYIYKMAKEALLPADGQFDQTLMQFESVHSALLNGGDGLPEVPRKRKDLLDQWDVVDAAWQQLRPALVSARAAYRAGGRRLLAQDIEALGRSLMEVEDALNEMIKLSETEDPPKETREAGAWTIIVYAMWVGFVCFIAMGAAFMELCDGRDKIDRFAGVFSRRDRRNNNYKVETVKAAEQAGTVA